MQRKIAVLWKSGSPRGIVEVSHGKPARLAVAAGRGKVSAAEFSFSSSGSARLEVVVDGARVERWRARLIAELTGREDGFTDGAKLIPGRPVHPVLAHPGTKG